MWTKLKNLLGLIRFSHTLFAMPFALSSALMAWDDEPFRAIDLVGIVLCMVFARSAAMAFNRIVDRRYDADNPRTSSRHLPTGQLSVRTAGIFTFICCVLFVGSTFLFWVREPSNPWPLYLSGPVLLFLLAYSFTKRFTWLCHVWLGMSLMMAPVAAWIAIRGTASLETPALLGLAVLFWVTGFDILYACQDVEFDRRTGLKSIPAVLGVRGALRLALICHMMMVGILTILWLQTPILTEVFLVGLVVMTLLLAYEHWLVSPSDLSKVNQAFFQVNVLISVGLLLVIALEVWLV